MSSRDIVLASIRRSLGVDGRERPRRDTVDERIASHPKGLIPERGQRDGAERLALFRAMVEASAATVETLPDASKIPEAVAAYLRARNLPSRIRHGEDPLFAGLAWGDTPLEVSKGPSDGHDLAGLSHAVAGIAETGTLVLTSGPDNPTTLNFLPDYHLVVVKAADVERDYEAMWEGLRARFGAGAMPRVVNWITGPSRSGDIEQKLLFGAHGPRSLHVMVVE